MGNMFFYLLLLLITHVVGFDMPETWINPADILHSTKIEDKNSEIPPSKPLLNTDNHPSSTCENFTCPVPPPSVCSSYLKRMVNLLLNEVNLKNYKLPKGDFRIIPLTLHFTSGNLEVLHKMASTENQEDISWSDFDLAFSSLFEESEFVKESKSEEPVKYPGNTDYTYFIFISIVGSLVIIAIWLLLTGGSIFKTIWSFSLLNFSFALVWNLMRAYNIEKEKVRELYHNRFKKSEDSSFGIFNPFFRLLSKSSESGSELPFLPESDPLVNVNYGKVFMETLGTVLELLPILGEKSGQMYAKFGESQNFFVRWLIMPLNLLFNPVLIIVGVLLWAIIREGFSFKIPLASFSIGNRARNVEPQPQQSPPKVETSVKSKLHIQSQPEQAFDQRSASLTQHSAQMHYENIAGPSNSSPKIKRIITEYHDSQTVTRDLDVRNDSGKIRDNSRIPSITVTRRGMVLKRRLK